MGTLKTLREFSIEAKKVVESLDEKVKNKPIKVLKKGESKEFKKIDKRLKK